MRALPVVLLGVVGPTCAGFRAPWSQAPSMVQQPWRVETILIEPRTAELGAPVVMVDAGSRPRVVIADHSFYMGTQSIAVGHREADGWRVAFPTTPAAWRVCGSVTDDDTTRITFGDLEGPLRALTWDGTQVATAEPEPCPRLPPDARERKGPDGTHRVERSRDGHYLWHEGPGDNDCQPHDAAPGHRIETFAFAVDGHGHPAVALYEVPRSDASGGPPGGGSGTTAQADAPGRLRYAECRDGEWTSSVVQAEVAVTSIDMTVDGQGRVHVAYVVEAPDSTRLHYATMVDDGADPGATPDTPPAPTVVELDPRVEPAVEACLRLHETPPRIDEVEGYQQGDPFRCVVLERDSALAPQAFGVLRSRCEAGEAPACAVAGSLHHFLMGDVTYALQVPGPEGGNQFQVQWRGIRPAGLTESIPEATSWYGRACELGDARGCLHHAALLPKGDPQRLPEATTACAAGLAEACAFALALSGFAPDQTLQAHAEPTLRLACEQDGRADACNALGVALHRAGQAEAARGLLRRACDDAMTVACDNLDHMAQ